MKEKGSERPLGGTGREEAGKGTAGKSQNASPKVQIASKLLTTRILCSSKISQGSQSNKKTLHKGPLKRKLKN